MRKNLKKVKEIRGQARMSSGVFFIYLNYF